MIRRRVALICLAMALSALTPAGGSAQFCLSQSDCEDGLFCTDDTCFLGVCVRTARNCADLNFGCTADSCSESANRCVHTVTVGLPCEDFNILTRDEHCNAQGECKGVITPDLACEDDGDCPGFFICVDGTCGPPEPTRVPTLPVAFTATSTPFRFTPITTARPSGTPTRSATRTSTATRPPTRTAEPTPVEQPTDPPTASPTVAATDALPTSTPSPSPPPTVQCPGDCNGDAAVAVNELVLGVNIALNGLPVSRCPALERDGSGAIDIAELVAAVSAALLGCA